MDPTATLRDLLQALRDCDRAVAFDRLEALLDWLSKGGSFPQVPVATAYRGYANRATWAVGLWLNNDRGTYLSCRRLAREARAEAENCSQVVDGTWTVPDARRNLLADRLEEYLEELNPIKNRPSAFADLLGAALEDVNYDELAADFLDDLAP